METGIAIGGPRDRVKISGSVDWDGRIREPNQTEEPGAIKRYYPGRYRWSAAIPAWVWVPDTERRGGTRAARSDGYSRKPL